MAGLQRLRGVGCAGTNAEFRAMSSAATPKGAACNPAQVCVRARRFILRLTLTGIDGELSHATLAQGGPRHPRSPAVLTRNGAVAAAGGASDPSSARALLADDPVVSVARVTLGVITPAVAAADCALAVARLAPDLRLLVTFFADKGLRAIARPAQPDPPSLGKATTVDVEDAIAVDGLGRTGDIAPEIVFSPSSHMAVGLVDVTAEDGIHPMLEEDIEKLFCTLDGSPLRGQSDQWRPPAQRLRPSLVRHVDDMVVKSHECDRCTLSS